MEALQRELPRMRAELARVRALLRSLETDVDESAKAPAMPAAQSGTDTAGGVLGARIRGESLLQQWVRDGTLIPSTGLGGSWEVSRQALDQAVERGELFSLNSAGRRDYLAARAWRPARQDGRGRDPWRSARPRGAVSTRLVG